MRAEITSRSRSGALVFSSSGLLRSTLLAGCVLAMGVAVWGADPAGYLREDPALARLLRGMAVLKGAAVIGAVVAMYWRFGWRVAPPIAMAYVVGASLLAGTTMLIWQLTLIPYAAFVFHAALIGISVAAWRDDRTR